VEVQHDCLYSSWLDVNNTEASDTVRISHRVFWIRKKLSGTSRLPRLTGREGLNTVRFTAPREGRSSCQTNLQCGTGPSWPPRSSHEHQTPTWRFVDGRGALWCAMTSVPCRVYILSLRQKVESPGLTKRLISAFDWPRHRSA